MGDSNFILRGPPHLKPLSGLTLGELLYDSVKSNIPSKYPALTDVITNEEVSWQTLFDKSVQTAVALKNYGIKVGDIVAIASENCIPFFYPCLGTLFIGATVSPINSGYIEGELLHALNVLKPNIIFCTKLTVEKFIKLKKHFNFLKKIVLLQSNESILGVKTLETFIETYSNEEQVGNFKPTHVGANEMAAILFSSGTTGLPKGVMLTHVNSELFLEGYLDPRFVSDLSFGLGDNLIGNLPIFHGYGFYNAMFSLFKGTNLIILKRFDPDLYLKTIQDYRIRFLPSVPPVILFLAKSPLVDKYNLSSLKYVVCGAAPLPVELQKSAQKRLKVVLVQGYGMTEVSVSVVKAPINNNRLGSVGKLLPEVEGKIRDPETGKTLGRNKVGEICFRGQKVMKGYYGNEEETKNSFDKDGFYRTGDLGYFDNDGFLYVVDRLKELIKYKGFQVPPAELEAVLSKHPKILDAGVVGIPDESAGELPVAFVVKTPGVPLTEKEVQDFVASQVSSPKRLRGGVFFISAIPKSVSGKILRRELKTLLNRKSKL